MTFYWTLYVLPLLGVFSPVALSTGLRKMLWYLMVIVFCIFIGFRSGIGGDWSNYIEHLSRVGEGSFESAIRHRSIGYSVVNWVVARLGLGIYSVNTICAGLFLLGLSKFCLRQPSPWLAWLILTPYLIFVVSMGHTAQSVAIGFVFWALIKLEHDKVVSYLVLVLIASLFHVSALVMCPLAVVSLFRRESMAWLVSNWKNSHNRTFILLSALFVIVLVISVALVSHKEVYNLFRYYILRDSWNSQGANIRILMNLFPAIVLIMTRYMVPQNWNKSRMWNWVAWLVVISVPGLAVSTTVADRLSWYIIAIQPYCLVHLPGLFRSSEIRGAIVVMIVLLYAGVLWTWFSYAEHAFSWRPYMNGLLS